MAYLTLTGSREWFFLARKKDFLKIQTICHLLRLKIFTRVQSSGKGFWSQATALACGGGQVGQPDLASASARCPSQSPSPVGFLPPAPPLVSPRPQQTQPGPRCPPRSGFPLQLSTVLWV